MNTTLKTLILIAISSITAYSQSKDLTPLKSFDKIITSPRVNLILEKGDKESVRFEYNDIPKNKVNVVVEGNKLKIFLDHARIVERQIRITENGHTRKRGIYSGSSITAYVTYKELKAVEIRGEVELRCDTELAADKFKLRAYGETEIRLASLTSKKLKVSLYGENDLKIKSGTTDRQVYRLFGENKIDTRGLKSEVASTRIYGEGRISVSASDEVRINALGEPTINIEGTSFVSKGIVLGHANINVNR